MQNDSKLPAQKSNGNERETAEEGAHNEEQHQFMLEKLSELRWIKWRTSAIFQDNIKFIDKNIETALRLRAVERAILSELTLLRNYGVFPVNEILSIQRDYANTVTLNDGVNGSIDNKLLPHSSINGQNEKSIMQTYGNSGANDANCMVVSSWPTIKFSNNCFVLVEACRRETEQLSSAF